MKRYAYKSISAVLMTAALSTIGSFAFAQDVEGFEMTSSNTLVGDEFNGGGGGATFGTYAGGLVGAGVLGGASSQAFGPYVGTSMGIVGFDLGSQTLGPTIDSMVEYSGTRDNGFVVPRSPRQ